MSRFSSRLKSCRRGNAVAGLAVLAVALSLGGCATRAPSTSVAYSGATMPAHAAPHQYSRPAAVPIPIEDDGIEAQPPPRLQTPVKDDPTEPFSPNYGRFTALTPAREDAAAVYVPNDLPPDFQIKLAQSVARN